RHTRSKRDWSSDVCSSDLDQRASPEEEIADGRRHAVAEAREGDNQTPIIGACADPSVRGDGGAAGIPPPQQSESPTRNVVPPIKVGRAAVRQRETRIQPQA